MKNSNSSHPVPGLRLWVLLFPLLLLAGCAVGPNYQRPKPDVPLQFRAAPISPATNSIGDLPWWQVFKDDHLDELVRTAFTNNFDLRIAIARVEQARAIFWQSRAAFLPQFDYEAGLSRGKNTARGNAVFSNGTTANNFVVAGNVAWEVDLWGRIRRLNESAWAQYLASQEARRGVMTTLLSDVATSYFRLLAFDELLAVARRSTNSFAESLRIFTQRLQGGIVSKLESAAAEAALASAAATVPDLERQIVIEENRLNILLGCAPGAVPRARALEDLSEEIPSGLPSSLLERRPDIRQAEQVLRSANAQVGAAVADFFPKLSLTGLFGQVSPELSALTGGGANAWSLGANLAGPLFHGGQLVGAYRQAKAVKEEDRLRYESTVLTALQEVSDALISRQKYAEARVQQARAVAAYQVAVQVATERYVAGRAGYFEVLQEQQQLFPAENALVQTRLNQTLALVQLYRALGGGWIGTEPADPTR